MHVVPSILLNKLVSFTINPKNILKNKNINNEDNEDIFYKILNTKYDDFNILSKKVIKWSELHILRLPSIIYDSWYNIITSNT